MMPLVDKDNLIKYLSVLNEEKYVLFNYWDEEDDLIFFLKKDKNLLVFVDELYKTFIKDTNGTFTFSKENFWIDEVNTFIKISSYGKNGFDTISWPYVINIDNLNMLKTLPQKKCLDLFSCFEETLPF